MAYGNDWLESLMELTNHIEKTEGRDAAYKFAIDELDKTQNSLNISFVQIVIAVIIAMFILWVLV